MSAAATAPTFLDSHCHVQEGFEGPSEELDAVLARAGAAGVAGLVCVGTSAATSQAAIDLARSARGPLPIWATVGLHPHDATEGSAAIAALAAQYAADPAGGAHRPGSVVAIGECGLDYHYDHSPRPLQRRVFAEQIALARAHGLALVVHTREAWDDTVAILAAEDAPRATVIHCFTGGPDEARRMLDLGCYLSFSGIVTFKNAEAVREAARLCPADRLLVETDAPYLAPVPHRGRPNEPAFVALVGAALAGCRGVEVAALAEQAGANTVAAFDLSR